MFNLRSALLGGVATLLLAGAASAAPVIDAQIGGSAAGNYRYNFNTLTGGQAAAVGNGPSLAVNITPNAAAVTGSASGLYAAPFLSGDNSLGFDNAGPGATPTQYLTTGSTGAVGAAQIEIVLPFATTYLGLLWGSIDAYNTLTFFKGADSVFSLTGNDVFTPANGNQQETGTRYVNITSLPAFDRVVATSSQYAFEFDNLALVPEPGTLALLGAGLLGLGFARRRKAA